jgi:hypothetical protein
VQHLRAAARSLKEVRNMPCVPARKGIQGRNTGIQKGKLVTAVDTMKKIKNVKDYKG